MRSNSSYVINPDAFSVNPALVGLPLARPARRLTAMLIDLTAVSLLVHAGGGVLLGLAAAYVAFRFAGRLAGKREWMGRGMGLTFRALGGLFLFLLALNLWNRGRDFAKGMLDGAADATLVSASAGPSGVPVKGRQAMGIARLLMEDDEAEARRLAPEVIRGLRASGVKDEEIRGIVAEGNEDGDKPWLAALVDSLLPAPRKAVLRVDSLAAAYAAAVQAGDTAAVKALGPALGSRLAADSLRELRAEQSSLHRQLGETRKELEQAQNRGIVSRITGFLDEMGIGFGWSGLYFTAFVALWNGQTPGKRMMGIRVLRLNGQPMNFWTSFERFGGYAAGLVTGLLGFAQVYWDKNRMMIHDKIIETVVVRDRRAGDAPAPSPAAPPAHQEASALSWRTYESRTPRP
ncbi:RDD family protein [Longimicrobium terrae]|uniref:Putative RDD family membrane protein YckC n=1 Tax=Longimicrobium terrae TaxID=1639882 RepID=A0A841H6V6_9BACT|nr:RDD family protein [Longimicrobium terrae]MBB4638199.1 putative RDD family membrane protein YckC [Longimicrobium terrae]MBB6073642.1 putative RDD family membrane protein YckC [Longimicrobium terrae]NNC30321.1 RDD family protein [Longimicrobium terrae]